MSFEVLDGARAALHLTELQDVHADVYAGSPYHRAGEAAEFADRFRVQRRQPGFALVMACRGGFVIGWASGMPLRQSTSWWRDVTTELPADVTDEHGGRSFALTELLVRAAWRRQGIARTLHDLILSGRPEERATATVEPGAAAAQHAFRSWGWQKLARTRDPRPGSPLLDVLVMALPLNHRGAAAD